jgi:hypothetical protein
MCPARAVLFTAALVAAAGQGLPPRSSASDYPAHQTTDSAMIAAAVVPSERVRKIFSFEVDKNYSVVEVAVYPQGGRSVDVDTNDFVLKVGSDDTIYPAAPHEIGSVWKEKNPPPAGGVRVETASEIGVIVGSGRDPVTGRNETRSGVYTAESVGVTNRPAAPPPPPPSSASNREIEAKMRDQALPEGLTSKAVAGYIFFPASAKRRKAGPLELRYSKDNKNVDLPLPAK